MVNAVGYNPSALMHSVYSEDFSLLGIQSYTVTATMTQYTSVSETLSASIEFIDPCPDPESVVMSAQIDPTDYYYTA